MCYPTFDDALPTFNHDTTSSGKPQPQMPPTQPVGDQFNKHPKEVQQKANSDPMPQQDLASSLYEGYTFFKADPAPGQEATWSRVERTKMHLNQSEFFKMVQKRANKISSAKQYQTLSAIRRAHINQLIHEQRRSNPQIDWSCVYAKECLRPSKARNAGPGDEETVSMDIVLMKRPIETQSYPRTPMGDLVDLRAPFQGNGGAARHFSGKSSNIYNDQPRHSHSWPLQSHRDSDLIEDPPKHVVQGPQPQPTSVTSPFTRLDLSHGPGQRSSTIDLTAQTDIKTNLRENEWNRQNGLFRWIAAVNESSNLDDANSSKTGLVGDLMDWSSEPISDEDEDSIISEQSDETSATDDLDAMDDDQEPAREKMSRQHRSRSPNRHERNYEPYSRRQNQTRQDRNHPIRGRLDLVPIRNIGPVTRTRRTHSPRSRPGAPTKRFRSQPAEMRNRNPMHEQHEIRIRQWKQFLEGQARMLQKTIDEARQLEIREPIQEASSTHTCRCCNLRESNFD